MGKEIKYKYLFGPVQSRRLGMSLGVDLMPHKTCSMDCTYCECGRTTNLTVKRREYVPTEAVIEEISDFLGHKPQIDYVTFSGSGEPTLHSGIGKIIRYIKKYFSSYKIALLTNGSMFSAAAVRKEVINADIILPSLDAVSYENFKKVNRPAPELDTKKIVIGLEKFRKIFKGKIWLEILIVPGANDCAKELNLLKKAVKKIKPDKIQINTLDRPGTEKWVIPEEYIKLKKIAEFFGKDSEVVAADPRKKTIPHMKKTENGILDTIKRRPCTFAELMNIAKFSEIELNEYLAKLIKNKKIVSETLPRGRFFKIRK